jgi:apolipoprotein N-acyltransferase
MVHGLRSSGRLMHRASARVCVSVLSGCLAFLAVPTFDVWPLMWVAFVLQLHVALTATTSRRAFAHGGLSGFVANAGGFYWLFALFQRFGRLPAVAAAALAALYIGYLALKWAFLSWSVRRLRDRTGLPIAILAPLAMVPVELLLPQVFPYTLAFSQTAVLPLLQIVEWTGMAGVTFVMLAVNGAVCDLLLARAAGRRGPLALRSLAITALGVVAVFGYGVVRIRQIDALRDQAPKARVGIVEPHTRAGEVRDSAANADALATLQRLSSELGRNGVDVVVWPEAAYPQEWPRARTNDFPLDDGRRVRRGFETPLLFGATSRAAAASQPTPLVPPPYNSALLLDERGDVAGLFDKVSLVPFSEYVPFDDRFPSLSGLLRSGSRVERGAGPVALPLRIGDRTYRLGPLICYEDVLPDFVRRVAALRPHLLVNLTNDAWFGDTSEPHEHLALAVFRSIEHRVDMVRASNSGVSAHIDAAGRVRRSTPAIDSDDVPRPAPLAIAVEVALLEPSGLYGTVGDAFGYGCAAVLAILLLWRRARRRDPPVL